MSIQPIARIVLGIGFLFSFCLTFGLFAEAATSRQKVVITFAGLSERFGVLFVAKDQRFFEKYGLEAEIVQVRGGLIAVSPLVVGDANFYLSAVTGAILGAMAGGVDIVFIAGLVNKLDGYFVVSPKIKNPADLKGKTLGVQSIGGGIWMFTMMALDHWGLDLERDKIQFRVIGEQSVILQALTTGSVDGAFLGGTFSKMAERQGSHILADIAKADIPFQGIGVLARRSFVKGSPETTERTLKVLGEAIGFLQEPANKQAVMRSLVKWLRLPRLEDAETGYETMKTLYDRRMIPTKEGVHNVLRILSKADAKFLRLKSEDLVDDQMARKLEREGFFK